MDIESLESYFFVTSVVVLVLIMIFIVYDLAKKSKANKFGTIVLFISLCLGITGFTVKLMYYFFAT